MEQLQPGTSIQHIVVIDAHPAVPDGLSYLFGGAPYALVAHPRVVDALAVVLLHHPVLVVIDLQLAYPESGLDLVRALRKDPVTATLPILVWSTELDVEHLVAALGLPGVEAVSKYVDGATVRETVERLLRPSRERTWR